jgi:alanine racemase
MTEGHTRPPIEHRLAAAGLPGLPRTAWLEIDLDALGANLSVLRGLAGSGVPVRPVVKADAYGHGAIPVARALEAAGVDGLCLATVDEAMELREAGIRTPILVLYPPPPRWDCELARAGIAVAVGELRSLTEMIDHLAEAGPIHQPLSIELEIETGLGRGGFVTNRDLVAAANLVVGSQRTRLAGLWTHFQAVEDAAVTKEQVARFEAAVAAVAAAGIPLPPRHAAASAALIAAGVVSYDGVRPGLALYGVVPDELEPTADGGKGTPPSEPFLPVMALYARPVRVADLPEGSGISYGPTFRTTRPSRIATLPVGYGDGWSRALSNRASAIVRGQTVPLVGNVAMDAVMADVTDVPGRPVDHTDEFVLMGQDGGERITALDLAQARTTNTWEVLTGMARRLPRVYHAAAGPVGLRTLTEGRG